MIVYFNNHIVCDMFTFEHVLQIQNTENMKTHWPISNKKYRPSFQIYLKRKNTHRIRLFVK